MTSLGRCATLCLLAITITAGTAWSFRGTVEPTDEAFATTSAFLDLLSDDQKAITVLPYDSPERPGWHFIPKDKRKGLPIVDMSDEQRQATAKVLQSILSETGYFKVQGARKLEAIVRDIQAPGSRWSRDPNEYYMTVFGEPSAEGEWGLSFEGHHVSLNFAFNNGRIVGSTPQFLGAHPATLMAGQETKELEQGFELLGDEANIAFELAASLTDGQRSIAQTSTKAQKEILGAGEAQPPYGAPVGVPGREMTPAQRELLGDLITTYAEVAVAPVAAQRLIDVNGLDDVYFSYTGTMSQGEPHSYTVQGQTFAIEYANTQPDSQGNPANHAHCIWRDMRGDFAIAK